MKSNSPSHARPLVVTALALAVSALALPAAAETSPYYIGLSQRFTHIGNLFQAASGGTSDTLSTTSLLAGVDQRISRQRVFGDATLSTNRYSDASALNHGSYSVRAGLDWETVERLSGTLAFDTQRSQVDVTKFTPPSTFTTTKGLTQSSGVTAAIRVGVVTRLTGEVILSSRRARTKAATGLVDPLDASRPNFNDLDTNEASIGVRYRPEGSLVLGAALRSTQGSYPNYYALTDGAGAFVRYAAEDFQRTNLDLTALWPISGASTVNARISLGRDKYDTASARNFSGLTGELGWAWVPTGKLSLRTSLARNSGDELSSRLSVTGDRYNSAVNRLGTTLAVEANYAVTGKITAKAVTKVLDSAVAEISTESNPFSVRTTSLSLGLVWQATRAIRAGCDLASSSSKFEGSSSSPSNSSFGCFADITLR